MGYPHDFHPHHIPWIRISRGSAQQPLFTCQEFCDDVPGPRGRRANLLLNLCRKGSSMATISGSASLCTYIICLYYLYLFILAYTYVCVYIYVCSLIFVILGRKTQRCRETGDFRGNLFTGSDHVEDQEIDSDKVVPSSYLTWFVSRLTRLYDNQNYHIEAVFKWETPKPWLI